MNQFDLRAIESLQAGKVTHKTGHGKSMEPLVMDGSKQTLIPILSAIKAEDLGCKHWTNGQVVQQGELWYITPDEIQVGDAVFCKCAHMYTHEVHQIGGNEGDLEFYIGRHDKKHYNGWTRKVYGKCLTHRDV